MNCNFGVSQGGVCVCHDDYSGPTCLVENFCRKQEIEGFTFPQTPIGWFAYSVETCPSGTSAGKPKASTRCMNTTGSAAFEELQKLNCSQTLSNIEQSLNASADLESLASSTQILTSKPEALTPENVTTAVQIADSLLKSENITESVRVAAVATVSQLLDAKPVDTTSSLSLTKTLDDLSVNLTSSQLVQPNLVVQSAQVPAGNSQGVQFTSLSGKSGSFVPERIKLDTNASEIKVDEGFTADALIHIRFSEGKSVRQNQSSVSLGFVLYQNDNFFQSKVYKRDKATIRVLSGTVKGWEREVVPPRVEMRFRPTLINGKTLHDFSCVFWDYDIEDWSTYGCWKGSVSDGMMTCFCNHTTNFAALWSFKEDYDYAEALDIISIVGLSFSILGLVVTIIHHLTESFQRKPNGRQNNPNSKMARLSICVCLLAFIITFLSGAQNSPSEPDLQTNSMLKSDEYVEAERVSCTVVTALLHFFLFATFMWNSIYGTQLVLLIRTMRRSLPSYWTPLSLVVGFGVPAVFMAVTLGATYRMDNPQGYRQEEFCWLAALDKNKQFDFGKPMFWGFVVPLGVILIYNTVLLVLVSMTTCRVDYKLTSTRRQSQRDKFLVSFSLAVMLGLSWALGYLVLVTTDPTTHLVFSIFFCICTTTQGFQIFILFTARTPTFRAAVLRSFHSVSSASNNMWKTVLSSTSSEDYEDIVKKETSSL